MSWLCCFIKEREWQRNGLLLSPFLFCSLGVSGGVYNYTDHLLSLDGKRPDNLAIALPDVAGWSHIETLMSADLWDEQLASYPDATYWAFLVKDLREGFGIGFRNGPNRLGSPAPNMQSASLRPSMIGEFLSAELKSGRVLGPVRPGPAASIQGSVWFGPEGISARQVAKDCWPFFP